MQSTRSYLVLAFTLVPAWAIPTAPASAADKLVQVFILAGQSNMVGHGKTRDGLNPEYDSSQPKYGTADLPFSSITPSDWIASNDKAFANWDGLTLIRGPIHSSTLLEKP